MTDLIYKDEAYEIIGICMTVHNNLGAGFLEIVNKDALEYEFSCKDIPFEREKEYTVHYKSIILPHKFYADFVAYDKIILEIKYMPGLCDEHIAQTLNYLKVSDNRLGLLLTSGKKSCNTKELLIDGLH